MSPHTSLASRGNNLLSVVLDRWYSHGQEETQASLLTLPPELLIQIVDFLEVSDVACLALCNRTLRHYFASPAWDLLRNGKGMPDERRAFLTRLAKDEQGRFFYCYTCSLLHLTSLVGPPGASAQRHPQRVLRCVQEPPWREARPNCFKTHAGNSRFGFTFQHLQLATAGMLELDALAIIEVQRFRKATTLLSVEAALVSSELRLRVQQWIAFDQDEVPGNDDMLCLSVCEHINRRPYYHCQMHPDLIRCKIYHLDQRADCRTCHSLLRCSECATEFHVEVKTLEVDRSALVITKW